MRTTIGGEPVNKKYEKWELISHHTGRRSSVSLMLKEHDSITVESLVGMSAMTVRKYDKRTRSEIADSVKSSSFYNRKQEVKEGDNKGDIRGTEFDNSLITATSEAGKGFHSA